MVARGRSLSSVPTAETVAVIQPYFVPYPGYFRLFAAADVVVLFDCVQFTRRGFVHRNRLPNRNGEPAWLTLPLLKAAVTTPISALEFATGAAETLAKACRKFPSLDAILNNPRSALHQQLLNIEGRPVDYIAKWLRLCCEIIGLPFRTIRSSALAIDPSLRGPDRVLAIVEELGGKRYVNPPGGRDLYDPSQFQARGVELDFLPDYQGSYWSILHLLATESPESIKREITGTLE